MNNKRFEELTEKVNQATKTIETVTKELKKLSEEREEPRHLPGRWEPNAEQGYFYNNQHGDIVKTVCLSGSISKATIQHDRAYENCGETKEEIKSVHDRKLKYQAIIDKIVELNAKQGVIDWGSNQQYKFYWVPNHEERELTKLSTVKYRQQPGQQYCLSKEIQREIESEFGKPAIALCFFGVGLED